MTDEEDVTRYYEPYPQMTDVAPGAECCPARGGEPPRWECSRPPGHTGDHEAGGMGGRKYASWAGEA